MFLTEQNLGAQKKERKKKNTKENKVAHCEV